jgi:predicted transcriptional regulator
MTKKGTTKDELFLVKLHEMACQRGEYTARVNRYEIGRAIGQNDKGIDTIVKHLAQANFIKKGDGSAVYLTSNGLQLIESHLKSL